MKKICIFLTLLVVLLIGGGCESDSQLDRLSEINVVRLGNAYSGVGIGDKTVFTGNDIIWFNEKTRELKLKDGFELACLPLGGTLLFKLADMELFTVRVFSNLMNESCEDMVLFYDSLANKYYLHESYPGNTSSETVRLNSEIRAENWALFLIQLRREGRMKE